MFQRLLFLVLYTELNCIRLQFLQNVYVKRVDFIFIFKCSWLSFCFQDFATLDVKEIKAKVVEQLKKEKKELMDRIKNQEKEVRIN